MAALSVHSAAGGMNSSTPQAAAISPSFCRIRALAATPPPTPSRFIPVRFERLARLGHDGVHDGFLKACRQVAHQLGARVDHDLPGILAVKGVADRGLEAGKAQQQPLVVQERPRERERRRIARLRRLVRSPGRRGSPDPAGWRPCRTPRPPRRRPCRPETRTGSGLGSRKRLVWPPEITRPTQG